MPEREDHRQLAGLQNTELVRLLREALSTIRFGTVTLVIQDGRVIQMEKSEKMRLSKAGYVDGSGI